MCLRRLKVELPASDIHIVRRQLNWPEAGVVLVPSIEILKFLSSDRNDSGWPSSKLDIFIL